MVEIYKTYDQDGFRRRAGCVCFRDQTESEVLRLTSSFHRWFYVIYGSYSSFTSAICHLVILNEPIDYHNLQHTFYVLVRLIIDDKNDDFFFLCWIVVHSIIWYNYNYQRHVVHMMSVYMLYSRSRLILHTIPCGKRLWSTKYVYIEY